MAGADARQRADSRQCNDMLKQAKGLHEKVVLVVREMPSDVLEYYTTEFRDIEIEVWDARD